MGSSQQVMLEVRFAEVTRSVGKEIGIGGFGASGSFDAAIGKGAQLIPGPGGAGLLQISSITDQFGIFRKQFSVGGLNIEGIINGLESKGLAKTLAQPTLLALSGEKASFLAGGEFPVPVAQSNSGSGTGSQAITVEFKPFGVSLGFTPTVLGDKTINLIVEPEVSAIDPSASFSVGNITVPGLRTRRASTTLELRDGESFAIAGLISKDFQTTVDQVPLLGSIPILGALFRSTNFKKGETELLIVVTPRLVAPISPSQVRLPTDRVKDPDEFETFLLGEPYHPQPIKPVVPDVPVSQAAPAEAAPPQAAAELPAKKEKDYDY
jgi:pilus assembly protein CpaC